MTYYFATATGGGPVMVSPAVVGYAPEVASMVVRAAELPA